MFDIVLGLVLLMHLEILHNYAARSAAKAFVLWSLGVHFYVQLVVLCTYVFFLTIYNTDSNMYVHGENILVGNLHMYRN